MLNRFDSSGCQGRAAGSDLSVTGAHPGSPTTRSKAVKYLLQIYMNPATFETLSEEDLNEVFRGHDEFIKAITESGEMVGTEALTDPSNSATVRVRAGVPAVTDGPYLEAKEYVAGYYLVDCETKERAIELAALIPDAKYTAIEVRPLMSEGGTEL
jgi:hypothetical protein